MGKITADFRLISKAAYCLMLLICILLSSKSILAAESEKKAAREEKNMGDNTDDKKSAASPQCVVKPEDGEPVVRSDEITDKDFKDPISDAGKIDLKLSRKSAEMIAEAVLIQIYGNDILNQRPWKVHEKNEYYIIEGTFHSKSASKGGVAYLKLRKDNAQVIGFTHGK